MRLYTQYSQELCHWISNFQSTFLNQLWDYGYNVTDVTNYYVITILKVAVREYEDFENSKIGMKGSGKKPKDTSENSTNKLTTYILSSSTRN